MLAFVAFMGYVMGVVVPLILAAVMIGCKKKSIAEQPATPAVPPSNKDVQLTPSQQAKLEAEMAAALEAEKKAKEDTTKATASNDKNSTAPNKDSDAGGADPNPPVSLQKPMSLGVTKAVDVKSPGVPKSPATPAVNGATPASPMASEKKKDAKDGAGDKKKDGKDATDKKKDAKDGKDAAKDGKLPPGKPPKLPPNMSAADDGQSKFISPTPCNLAVSHYVKPTTPPAKK
uniref:Uncharacterized protein n=1 Tax=Panagrellus redivivus TaxID=6233 RepID=A0A7E4VJW7_PANRE